MQQVATSSAGSAAETAAEHRTVKLEHLQVSVPNNERRSYWTNGWVSSRLVETATDNVGSRIDAGRMCQTRGPSTAKERSPNVVLVDGARPLRLLWTITAKVNRKKSVAEPVANGATAKLRWCAPYVSYEWSFGRPHSGRTVVALVHCLKFRYKSKTWATVCVTGWSVVIGAAAGSNQRGRQSWHDQPSLVNCPDYYPQITNKLTVNGCWQTVAAHLGTHFQPDAIKSLPPMHSQLGSFLSTQSRDHSSVRRWP